MPPKKERKSIKEDTKEKKWRFNKSRVGLSYSRCDMPKEMLFSKIHAKYPIANYYIVQEEHKEPAEPPKRQTMFHLHAYIEFTKAVDSRNVRFLDVEYDGHNFHPNFTRDANRTWIKNYLQKFDRAPFASIAAPNYIRLAKEGKVDDALANFADMHPKEFLINYDRIVTHCRRLAGGSKPTHVYPLQSEPLVWDQKKCLVLWGATASGKTELAKSTIVHMEKTFMLVRHIDQLKKYSGEDFLIFDDMSFNHWPREACIHLTDLANISAINCRHVHADIPAGVGRIFTTNNTDGLIFPYDQHGAIDRRIEVQMLSTWSIPTKERPAVEPEESVGA